jgi:DNA-directed RNA polymerase specialized sigma24 family protein
LTQAENIPWNDWLGQAHAGQISARECLCRELTVRLRVVAQYRLWGWPQADRDDVVQDCLTTFLQKMEQVTSNPHLYAGEILRHKIGDALRRKTIRVPLETDCSEDGDSHLATFNPALNPEDGDGFAARTESRDRMARVQEAIKHLSSFCRTFFLGVMEEQSVQELWGFFKELEPDLQRSAFDKRIFDCRRKLKQLVSDTI